MNNHFSALTQIKRISVPLWFSLTLLLLLLTVFSVNQEPAHAQSAVGTEFTYQGQLEQGDTPADGTFDFRFRLYDGSNPATATLLGTVTKDNVTVSDGIFTVQLDFGAVFTGSARWLEIGVAANGGTLAALTPLQPLTPAPYAMYGQDADANSSNEIQSLSLTGNQLSLSLGGGTVTLPTGVTYSAGAGITIANNIITNTGDLSANNELNSTLALSGTTLRLIDAGSTLSADLSSLSDADGSATNELNTGLAISGTILQLTDAGGTLTTSLNSLISTYNAGSGITIADSTITNTGDLSANNELNTTLALSGTTLQLTDAGGSLSADLSSLANGWQLTGNSGTDPSTNFLGTTDNTALTIKVNDTTALQVMPGGTFVTPNIIGGYSGNSIQGDVSGSVIGGGGSGDFGVNTIFSDFATVGGGAGNTASSSWTVIAGGGNNIASNGYSIVGGGLQNTASGILSTVGGGAANLASGTRATVPGGQSNQANGDYSFAAGYRARANNQGCFVWADRSNTSGNVTCNTDHQWLVRAAGGVYFYTNGGLSSGVYLDANGSSWNTVSDQARKENFAPIDTQALLERLAETPITTWNYKAQDPAIRHIGPMAQDFNTLLPDLGGEGEKYINSLDADGVALAAIQGLYARSQSQTEQIAALEQQIETLESRLTALEAAQSQSTAWPFRGVATGWLLVGGVFAGVVIAGRNRLWGSRG